MRDQVRHVVIAAFIALAGCDGQLTENRVDQGAAAGDRDASPAPGAFDSGTPPSNDDDAGGSLDAAVDSDASVGEQTDGGTTPESDAEVAVIGSPGCGSASAPPEGEQTLEINGKTRTFIVHAPDDYDASKPYPLVFGFHGATRTAADFDNDKGGIRFGPAMGDRAVLVYPNALKNDGGTTTWSRDTDDDLDFFDAMVAKLRSDVCIDDARIFSTGHSSGGYWSNTLGCRRGNVLRAIAPVAGGIRDFKDCAGPVATWAAHGTPDNTVPVKYGRDARDHWLEANGCSDAAPTATSPSPCVAYAGCSEGHPVHWCEHNEPTYGNPPTYHGWPSFATAAITAFFDSF